MCTLGKLSTYTRLPGGSPCIKMVIYTVFFQKAQPNSAIYTAAGCQIKIVIYTAAVRDLIQIYTGLSCVNIKLLFTRQPFQSQFTEIHTGLLCFNIKLLFTRQPF